MSAAADPFAVRALPRCDFCEGPVVACPCGARICHCNLRDHVAPGHVAPAAASAR